MWNVDKVCFLQPPKSSRNMTGFCLKTLSSNSPLDQQFLKFRKIMFTSHSKLSFCVRYLRLYTPVINLIIIRWSFSNWYGDTAILADKAHFALTIASTGGETFVI